ncbi:MAG: hypothetical protein LH475_07315 [Cryobacterium sp.]|uniref:hypothetical protein n=1 Tax=unclassified Cryobacterium TaxID=2649013 RepID=UPI0018C9DF91|nr:MULTISPECIES: hypothetical protein [unclassified Cryobacterium]MCY7404418.1 hypothetical protein [Cryobacterium sp.]MEC5155774.1 hypothetical protein [Cryobacterium sp. CAN_C3]
MMLPVYLGLLEKAERALASSYRQVAEGHGAEPDIYHLCQTLAKQCDQHEQALATVIERYGERPDDEPERLHAEEMSETRSGPLGLLRDLQDLYLLANLVDVTWMMIKQAALGLRDEQLIQVVSECESQVKVQLGWLTTRMKQAAPQALIVAQ